MAALLPWRRHRGELAGDGNSNPALRDFPTLLRRMQGEFEGMLQRFASDLPASSLVDGWHWGLEMNETDDSFLIHAEAPGFEAGDFDIQVSGNRLTLRAIRKKEGKAKSAEYQERRECFESISLPGGLDLEKIDARYHSGVLELTIPKTSEFKSRKVKVKGN